VVLKVFKRRTAVKSLKALGAITLCAITTASNIVGMIQERSYMNEKIITVIGPMFAGKTTETINIMNDGTLKKLNMLAFKHSWDKRYEKTRLATHPDPKDPEKQKTFDAIAVPNSETLLNLFKQKNNKKKIDVVGIDEIHFFNPSIVSVIQEISNYCPVIAAGLDLDFRKESFDHVSKLIQLASKVIKLRATCSKCGKKDSARYTQRLIDGKPAKYDDPIYLVGGKECYEPRCSKCHICKKKR